MHKIDVLLFFCLPFFNIQLKNLAGKTRYHIQGEKEIYTKYKDLYRIRTLKLLCRLLG